MSTRRSLRAVASMSVLLHGVTALFFHGLVLCIGPEGHTAVEWFAAADCCPPAVAATLSDDRCGCTDSPLLQPFADKRDGDRLLTVVSPSIPLLPPPLMEHPDGVRYDARILAGAGERSARRNVVIQV